jgi:hypothetical protein
LKRDLRESRALLAHEQEHTKGTFGRERAQRSALHGLGLSEAEAVDYVLQLSRDEEEARRLHAFEVGGGDVFGGDFDALDPDTLATPMVERAEPPFAGWSASGTRVLPAPPSAASRSPPSDAGAPIFVASGPASGSAPRMIARSTEPRAAGFGSDYARTPPAPATLADVFSLSGEETHFPGLSRTPSSAGVSIPGTPSASARSASMSVSPQWNRVGSVPCTPGSPTSSRGTGKESAWSTPLRHRAPALGHTRSEPARANAPLSLSPPRLGDAVVDEDEELRFALELSLAEARSRGEDV